MMQVETVLNDMQKEFSMLRKTTRTGQSRPGRVIYVPLPTQVAVMMGSMAGF